MYACVCADTAWLPGQLNAFPAAALSREHAAPVGYNPSHMVNVIACRAVSTPGAHIGCTQVCVCVRARMYVCVCVCVSTHHLYIGLL